MIVRSEQIDAITRQREEDFASRHLPLFRDVWKDETAAHTDAELKEMLLKFIREARSFGIAGDQSLLRYASFQFGFWGRLADPAQYPQTAAILRDTTLDSNEKIDRLADWISRLSGR